MDIFHGIQIPFVINAFCGRALKNFFRQTPLAFSQGGSETSKISSISANAAGFYVKAIPHNSKCRYGERGAAAAGAVLKPQGGNCAVLPKLINRGKHEPAFGFPVPSLSKTSKRPALLHGKIKK